MSLFDENFDESFKEERKPLADLLYSEPFDDDEENIDTDFEEECTCIHGDPMSVELCPIHGDNLVEDEPLENDSYI